MRGLISGLEIVKSLTSETNLKNERENQQEGQINQTNGNQKLMNFQQRFSLEPLNQNLMKYREQNNPCDKYDFIGKTEAG